MTTTIPSTIDALAALPGLGETSARLLVEAGVPDVETLGRLGPIECYRRLRFHHGRRITLNFVYAMECAILGIHWRLLGADHKEQLKRDARLVDEELAEAARVQKAGGGTKRRK